MIPIVKPVPPAWVRVFADECSLWYPVVYLKDTDFSDTGPEDGAREEARVEEVLPENFDLQDMPPDDAHPKCAGTNLETMGWTDEDLDEPQQMARLEDARDAMSFITALGAAPVMTQTPVTNEVVSSFCT